MSYNGQMNFGLLGDYDALPDLDRIGDGIEASLEELVALARRRTGPSRTSTNGASRPVGAGI
jgi:diacylglycerol O-acyltransferase